MSWLNYIKSAVDSVESQLDSILDSNNDSLGKTRGKTPSVRTQSHTRNSDNSEKIHNNRVDTEASGLDNTNNEFKPNINKKLGKNTLGIPLPEIPKPVGEAFQKGVTNILGSMDLGSTIKATGSFFDLSTHDQKDQVIESAPSTSQIDLGVPVQHKLSIHADKVTRTQILGSTGDLGAIKFGHGETHIQSNDTILLDHKSLGEAQFNLENQNWGDGNDEDINFDEFSTIETKKGDMKEYPESKPVLDTNQHEEESLIQILPNEPFEPNTEANELGIDSLIFNPTNAIDTGAVIEEPAEKEVFNDSGLIVKTPEPPLIDFAEVKSNSTPQSFEDETAQIKDLPIGIEANGDHASPADHELVQCQESTDKSTQNVALSPAESKIDIVEILTHRENQLLLTKKENARLQERIDQLSVDLSSVSAELEELKETSKTAIDVLRARCTELEKELSKEKTGIQKSQNLQDTAESRVQQLTRALEEKQNSIQGLLQEGTLNLWQVNSWPEIF
jgi:regulator of replication initiation timing